MTSGAKRIAGRVRPIAKVGLVAVGYAGALLVAIAATSAYIAATGSLDRDMYSGMFAFGDSLLFLMVFAIAGTVPGGAALYFLRPYPAFWVVLAGVALVFAATAIASLYDHLGAPGAGLAAAWSAVASLRLLIAPLFALAFALSAIFAPRRGPRLALFCAAAIESAAFAGLAASWLRAY